MTLCAHQGHKTIDDIWEPLYHKDAGLNAVHKVPKDAEHFLIKFKKQVTDYPDWFYMSGKMIRSHKTQRNGGTTVYCVPLNKREAFEPVKQCEHLI